MAVIEGINSGFVTETPSGDPGGPNSTVDDRASGSKHVAPANAIKITEMGWWHAYGTGTDYQLGLYSHDAGNNRPNALLYSSGDTAIVGGVGTWEVITGLNIEITGGTTYWLAIQMDNVAVTQIDSGAAGSGKWDWKDGQTDLPSPWGTTDSTLNRIAAIYVVYEAAEGTNMQINVDDAYKEVSAIKVNVDDTWKEVAAAKVNKDDAWKEIF